MKPRHKSQTLSSHKLGIQMLKLQGIRRKQCVFRMLKREKGAILAAWELIPGS